MIFTDIPVCSILSCANVFICLTFYTDILVPNILNVPVTFSASFENGSFSIVVAQQISNLQSGKCTCYPHCEEIVRVHSGKYLGKE